MWPITCQRSLKKGSCKSLVLTGLRRRGRFGTHAFNFPRDTLVYCTTPHFPLLICNSWSAIGCFQDFSALSEIFSGSGFPGFSKRCGPGSVSEWAKKSSGTFLAFRRSPWNLPESRELRRLKLNTLEAEYGRFELFKTLAFRNVSLVVGALEPQEALPCHLCVFSPPPRQQSSSVSVLR